MTLPALLPRGLFAESPGGSEIDAPQYARATCDGDTLAFCLAHEAAPLPRQGDRLVVACADFTAANLSRVAKHFGDDVLIVRTSRQSVCDAIVERFGDRLLEDTIFGLERAQPAYSARTVVSASQRLIFFALAALFAAAFATAPQDTTLSAVAVLALWFTANAVFRGALVWLGSAPVSRNEPPVVPDAQLPVFSVIVPLYREAAVVPHLFRALDALDYPATKLDIVLVLEADDAQTIAAVESARRDERFRVLRLPAAAPRTKPKACNYALRFARGEFAVIYDAEDRPEPDQLRKAAAIFRALPDDVACLQARLNFFNASECWLTKMFTLDYSLWFDLLLPGLDRAGIPMPLGGTSNHFRTAALRAIHGWDPFNVTEDADIGIRLARLGYRVRTLDSTTFEEATTTFDNWLKQRTRWQKGYMQTWLVHMREPGTLLRSAGWTGFIGFQLFVGGTFASALLNPLLWLLFVVSHVFAISALGPASAELSFAGLVLGNGIFAYINMLGPFRRGWLELSPLGLLAPLYWLMISLAGYRGLFQLFRHASLWEKTTHGLSKMAPPP